MSGRRIRLDLSDFVLDLGSHRWMFLKDSKFSTVSDLVEQLKEEYIQLDEDDAVQVFMDGDFVIPPWESIEILQSGDLVKIVRTVGKEKKAGQNKSKAGSKEQASSPSSSNNGLQKNSADSSTKKRKQEDNKSKARKKPKVIVAQDSSSSSSSSDTAEDITSKVSAAPSPEPCVSSLKNKSSEQKKVSKIIPTQKVAESTSSDSSDSSTDDSDEKLMTVTKPPVIKNAVLKAVVKAGKPSSSDSDSSSDSSEEEESKKPEHVVAKSSIAEESKQYKEANTVVSVNPKRKRKRKNKNKNKLAPDQIPEFGPQIVPTTAAIRQVVNNHATSNNHVRFDNKQDESDNMEVEEQNDGGEEFTAEEIKKLYNQSVSSAVVTGSPSHLQQNGKELPSSGDSGRTNVQTVKDPKPIKPNGKNDFKVPVNTPDTSISCEDVLMKQFDENRVTNNSVVNKTAPKIVFTPRALSLKEMKKETPKNRNLKFSNQSQEPDLSQFSALLGCRDAVFDKNTDNSVEVTIEEKDYSAYHAVSESGPRVGDVIAFKVIEMGENYTPGVSDYKEGKVLECDGTSTVTFELLKMKKKNKTGKFEIGEDDDQQERVVTFKWAEVIEPRLMFP